MSLYSALFGVNPFAGMLLGFLGIGPGDVPRFRDCYVNEEGCIVIHTRTGGGNRPYYDCPESYKAETGDDGEGPWNRDLREIPGFLYDRDDDFDCTYADFIYRPSDDVASLVKQLSEIGAAGNPGERWQELFKEMEAGRDSPRVARALEAGKPVIEAISLHFTSAIEARSGETRSGSAEGESATPKGDAQPESGS